MAVLNEARALRDRLEEKLRKGEAIRVGTTAPKMTAAVTPPPSALALEKKAPPLGKSMAQKKCTNEAGEPVYCSTVTPSPSPSPSPAAVAPPMMCFNEAGEPAYCNSLAEREAADAKRAEEAKAQEAASERAAKHEQEVKAREAAEKIRSERAAA